MGRKATLNELVEAGLLTQAQAQTLGDDSAATFHTGQGSAVADASGGTTIDAEARTALNSLLAELRTLGIIAT